MCAGRWLRTWRCALSRPAHHKILNVGNNELRDGFSSYTCTLYLRRSRRICPLPRLIYQATNIAHYDQGAAIFQVIQVISVSRSMEAAKKIMQPATPSGSLKVAQLTLFFLHSPPFISFFVSPLCLTLIFSLMLYDHLPHVF